MHRATHTQTQAPGRSDTQTRDSSKKDTGTHAPTDPEMHTSRNRQTQGNKEGTCVERSTGWREVAPWERGRLEPQGDNVDQPSRIESL